MNSWAACIEEGILGKRIAGRSRYLLWTTRISSKVHPEYQADVRALRYKIWSLAREDKGERIPRDVSRFAEVAAK
eukprot:4746167-Karenia_brevis.AAC.1